MFSYVERNVPFGDGMTDSTHRYISACFRLMAIVLVVKVRKTVS